MDKTRKQFRDIIKELRLDGQNVAIKKTTGASSKTLCWHLDSP
jgi:hypothetical protein